MLFFKWASIFSVLANMFSSIDFQTSYVVYPGHQRLYLMLFFDHIFEKLAKMLKRPSLLIQATWFGFDVFLPALSISSFAGFYDL